MLGIPRCAINSMSFSRSYACDVSMLENSGVTCLGSSPLLSSRANLVWKTVPKRSHLPHSAIITVLAVHSPPIQMCRGSISPDFGQRKKLHQNLWQQSPLSSLPYMRIIPQSFSCDKTIFSMRSYQKTAPKCGRFRKVRRGDR